MQIWLLTEYQCFNLNLHGSLVTLSHLPFSQSASLNEATRLGALRMCAAGRLFNRKVTLITPNTTTMQFSSLAKASVPRECKVRHQRGPTGSNEKEVIHHNIHKRKTILSPNVFNLIMTDSLVYYKWLQEAQGADTLKGLRVWTFEIFNSQFHFITALQIILHPLKQDVLPSLPSFPDKIYKLQKNPSVKRYSSFSQSPIQMKWTCLDILLKKHVFYIFLDWAIKQKGNLIFSVT